MTRLNVLIGPLIIAAGISLGDVEFIGPGMVMPQASAVTGQREIAITSGRLLCEIAMILEDRFHKPVTYEDAILSWKGDVAFTTKARGLYPKERTLRLPADISFGEGSTLTLALLDRVLEEYHTQTDGPGFRAFKSRWGLHIVPTVARAKEGQFIQLLPVLDAHISIEKASRLPSEHFSAICQAVSGAVGLHIKPFAPYMDQYFALNGMVPPRNRELSDRERELSSFIWGIDDIEAREAIMDLIEKSATTFTWQLRCTAEPSDQYCVLYLGPIQCIVGGSGESTARRSIAYDRCKKCPNVPR